MNVQIYSLWKNPRIFERMNIFNNKYSHILEYLNIRYTLAQAYHQKHKKRKSLEAMVSKQGSEQQYK